MILKYGVFDEKKLISYYDFKKSCIFARSNAINDDYYG